MPFLRFTNLTGRPISVTYARTHFVASATPYGKYEDIITQETFDNIQSTLQRLKVTGQIEWNVTFYDADVVEGPEGDKGDKGDPGTTAQQVTGSAAIDAGALIKVSGAGTYAMLGAADDPSLMVGVAATACTGAGQSFSAQFVPGTVTAMLSDGSGPIANGASVCPSNTVSGRIKAGTTNSVGVNVGAAVAATLDASVSVL